MAEQREKPYLNFNYLVYLGEADPASPLAAFLEVSLPDVSIDVIEYRAGNDKENTIRKLPGLAKYGNVTLKRGIMGTLDLYEWLNQVRQGSAEARRTVVVQLLNEDRSEVVLTWKFLNAFPVKYTGPTLNGKGTDVAIEELTLAVEGMQLE